jgi:hypothetical protein
MIDLTKRHPDTQNIMKWLDYRHLQGPMRVASQCCHELAEEMLINFPDGPELTAGLRLLSQAKDCFVHCAVEASEASL